MGITAAFQCLFFFLVESFGYCICGVSYVLNVVSVLMIFKVLLVSYENMERTSDTKLPLGVNGYESVMVGLLGIPECIPVSLGSIKQLIKMNG